GGRGGLHQGSATPTGRRGNARTARAVGGQAPAGAQGAGDGRSLRGRRPCATPSRGRTGRWRAGERLGRSTASAAPDAAPNWYLFSGSDRRKSRVFERSEQPNGSRA